MSRIAEPPVPGSPLVLAGGRPAATVAFETDVVGFFVDAADLLGVPKSVAAIYGMVFASPVPLGFAEIEERVDLSKGSVSQGLRLLREVGAVKEASAKVDPLERFAPDLEMRQLIARFLKLRIEKQLKTGRGRLKALEIQLAALPAAERRILAPRLKKLENWHLRSSRLLPIIRAYLRVG